MNRLTLCLLGVLALTSCSKKFSLFNTSPDRFNLNNVDYEYITLKSKIKYEDGNEKHRATANVRIRRDSIIWFSISPGLGIEAARGIITSDSIKVINKIDKIYSNQAITDISQKFHFDFNLKLLESVLIGNLVWPVLENDKVVKSNGFYVIPKKDGELNVTNFIGTQSMKLEKILASSDSTSNTLEIKYVDFQQQSDRILPKNIDARIQYYTKKDNIRKISNITIEHTKVEIDNAKLKFSFSIPKKYIQK